MTTDKEYDFHQVCFQVHTLAHVSSVQSFDHLMLFQTQSWQTGQISSNIFTVQSRERRLPLASTPSLCCWCCPSRCPRPRSRQWKNHCSFGRCGNCLHSLLHYQCSSLSEVTSREGQLQSQWQRFKKKKAKRQLLIIVYVHFDETNPTAPTECSVR